MSKTRIPYLLTLDPKIANWGLRYFHRQLSLFLYSAVPQTIDYLFYVEIGKSGNVHAHGWFEVPVGHQTVVGVVLRKYRKRFGKYFYSTRKDGTVSIGTEYDEYILKDQTALAAQWSSTIDDIALCRATGKIANEKEIEGRARRALKTKKMGRNLDNMSSKFKAFMRGKKMDKDEYINSLEDPPREI